MTSERNHDAASNHDLTHVPPEQLARMLDVQSVRGWSDADVPAILRHQLDAPLLPELAQLPGVEMDRLRAALSGDQPVLSLLDALTGASQQIEVLDAIKTFARHSDKNPESPLQGIPATVIYYAALAAALLGRAPITQLSAAEMQQGFSWAKEQAGAERLRPLFESALSLLKI